MTTRNRNRQDIFLAGLVALAALLPRLVGLSRFLTADEPKSWFGLYSPTNGERLPINHDPSGENAIILPGITVE